MGAGAFRWNVTQSARSERIRSRMVMGMTILVDVEEDRSPVPRCLDALGAAIELVRLPVGDYLVAHDPAVERKTVRDLHASLVTGRLWSQLFALRRSTQRPYLVVEGANLDVGRVSERGVRGALLSIGESGVTVVRSVDPADTALWVFLLARRSEKADVPAPRRKGRRRMVASPSGVLATVPGVSPTLANRLLTRFGSIAGIAEASESDLQEIEGIGAVRAATLRNVLTRHTH